MLFVQCITLRYMKDVRYANYANQRKSIKFWNYRMKGQKKMKLFFRRFFFIKLLIKSTVFVIVCDQLKMNLFMKMDLIIRHFPTDLQL